MKISGMKRLAYLICLLFSIVSVSYASVYDTFLQCLTNQNVNNASAIVFSRENPSFTKILHDYVRNRRYERTTTAKPAVIVTPRTEEDVQAVVVCLKTIGNVQLKIRSGGHDYDGLSYVSNIGDLPFIVLDMFNLRSVYVDAAAKTAWAQAGATIGELYYEIGKHPGLGFPAGVCPTMGVGGHISGGGYGNLLRKYGLSVDNVDDARIVVADGKILDRAAMGEELFWAIRGGGGGSFGVVLGYKLNLVTVPAIVTVFRVEKTLAENATDAVHKWQEIAPKIDNNLFIRLLLQPVLSKNPKKPPTIRASFVAMYLGNSDELITLLSSEFPELGLKKSDCQELTWLQSVLQWYETDINSPNELLKRIPESIIFLKRKSDYVQKPIPKPALESLWKKLIALGKTGLALNPYGGKMDEISESATPFPHRAGNLFKIQYSSNWNDERDDIEQMNLQNLRELYRFMTPYVSSNPRSAFLNYRDVDIGINSFGESSYEEGKVYGYKYFGKINFDRLVKVKTAIDPNNLFRNEQSIPIFH